MPVYDLVLLLKKMELTTLKSTLARNAKYIIESGGTLRKMESLGFQSTPYKVGRMGVPRQKSAHYFILNYYAGMEQNKIIKDKFKRDLDVLRSTAFLIDMCPGGSLKELPEYECTLHEDLLPPPYRPSVIKLLEIAEKKARKMEKYKFKYNSGLEYDPF